MSPDGVKGPEDHMRIAIFTDSYYPTRDGVVTAVDTTRSLLESMGHEVFIVAPDPGKDCKHEKGVTYFKAVKFRTYKGYYVPIFPSNKTEIMKSLKPDVIHIHGVAFMALKALIASHNTGIPTVLTYVTAVTDVIKDYSPVKLPKEMLISLSSIYLRNMLKRPDCVIVPTRCTADEITSILKAKPRRLETIPIGVDTNHFTNNGKGLEIRKKYGIENRKVIITVGRISYEKNTDLLVRSMKLMDNDTVLLICGKGPAEKMLKKETEKANVTDKVIFAGFVPDDELVAYYSCADAMATASVFETQGLTVLEAMSCGIPIACGNGRAFTDFVKEDENGYLFNLSEEECAAAMNRALNAADRIKIASRKTAEKYSIRHTAEQLVRLYTEVIESKKGACQ